MAKLIVVKCETITLSMSEQGDKGDKEFQPSGFIGGNKHWESFCKFGSASWQPHGNAPDCLEINDGTWNGTIVDSGSGGLLTMKTQADALEGKSPDRLDPKQR